MIISKEYYLINITLFGFIKGLQKVLESSHYIKQTINYQNMAYEMQIIQHANSLRYVHEGIKLYFYDNTDFLFKN